MFSGQVSDTLKVKLAGETTREGTVGADASSRNEMDGRSRNGKARQFTAASRGVSAQGGNSGVYLAWVNPTAMRKTAGRRTNRAAFLMIEGGAK